MSRPDEGLIHTYLDGECTPEESARLERLIATDSEWAAAVAEARGLVAASSRILGALDAVPGDVMPSGSNASGRGGAGAGDIARAAPARPPFRLKAWHRAAAVLVLVLGTSYAVRVATEGPAAGGATADTAAATTSPRSSGASVAVEAPVSPEVAAVPPAGAAAEANRHEVSVTPPAMRVDSSAVATTMSLPAPPPARSADVATPAAVAPEARRERLADSSARAAAAERERTLSQVVVTGARSDAEVRARVEAQRLAPPPSRAAEASAGAGAARGATQLDGCWLVSAPDSLRGLLRTPTILRQSGDTLVLRLAPGTGVEAKVTRTGRVLRGDLTAVQSVCPTP